MQELRSILIFIYSHQTQDRPTTTRGSKCKQKKAMAQVFFGEGVISLNVKEVMAINDDAVQNEKNVSR